MCSNLMCEDEYLDGELHKEEIKKCIYKLQNNKTEGSDGLLRNLLKYGGVGMVDLLHQPFKLLGVKKPYLSSRGRG